MRRKRDLFVSRVLKSRIASRILSIKEQAYKIASLLPRRSLRLAVVPLVLTRSFSMSLRVWNDANPSIIDQVVLPLDPHAHKGSSGRIGILGGSERYTGAPYYAARAALYVGIDLVTVYTATEAALPLKCYSPELMVVPVYSVDDRDNIVDQMAEQIVPDLERLHCLVIGPGLGRSPWVFAGVARIIRECRERNLLVVMDADALYMLTQPEYHSLLEDCANVILTPNVMEQKRLDAAGAVCNKATIVRKGQVDGIYKGSELVMECHEEGGLKRSGGIGDVLAGTVGALAAWNVLLSRNEESSEDRLPFLCWTACCFVKQATRRAFLEKHRAMSAIDILEQLGPTIHELTTGQ